MAAVAVAAYPARPAMKLAHLVALLLACHGAACSPFVDTAPAERQVEHIHRLLDEARFETIYDESGQEMKQSAKLEDFVAFTAAVHRKLGAVQSAEMRQTRTSVGTGGTVIVLGYQTTFAEGPASETFTFRMNESQPQLVGYHVNSLLLVTK